MRNLHSIVSGLLEAYIWGSAWGRNGRALGVGADPRMIHAYRIERGTPPPYPNNIPGHWDQGRAARTYWSPWRAMLTPEQILTPACGRIRTASRSPRLNIAYPPQNYGPIAIPCTECQRIAPDTQYQQILMNNDPWRRLEIAQRLIHPDPVSGL